MSLRPDAADGLLNDRDLIQAPSALLIFSLQLIIWPV